MSGGNQGFKVDSGERWWPTDAYAIVTGGQQLQDHLLSAILQCIFGTV